MRLRVSFWKERPCVINRKESYYIEMFVKDGRFIWIFNLMSLESRLRRNLIKEDKKCKECYLSVNEPYPKNGSSLIFFRFLKQWSVFGCTDAWRTQEKLSISWYLTVSRIKNLNFLQIWQNFWYEAWNKVLLSFENVFFWHMWYLRLKNTSNGIHNIRLATVHDYKKLLIYKNNIFINVMLF